MLFEVLEVLKVFSIFIKDWQCKCTVASVRTVPSLDSGRCFSVCLGVRSQEFTEFENISSQLFTADIWPTIIKQLWEIHLSLQSVQSCFCFQVRKTLKFFITVERERQVTVDEKENNKEPLMILMIPDINIPNGNIFKCISFIWYSL